MLHSVLSNQRLQLRPKRLVLIGCHALPGADGSVQISPAFHQTERECACAEADGLYRPIRGLEKALTGGTYAEKNQENPALCTPKAGRFPDLSPKLLETLKRLRCHVHYG